MHNTVAYVKERSNQVYLPPFVVIRSEQPAAKKVPMAVIAGWPDQQSSGARGGEQESSCWIAVSGYQPDRAYMVYRFFLDIGHIVDKSFTESNLMYLRYYCMMDCEIALSYDGQKIGYAADIFVRVKLSKPVQESFNVEPAQKAIIPPAVSSAPIEEPNERQSPIGVIGIETESPPQAVKETATKRVMEKKRQVVPRKMSFLKWLQHKISYIM